MSIEEKVETSMNDMQMEENKTNKVTLTLSLSHEAETNTQKNTDLEKALLSHLIRSKAVFKSQQKNDPDLSVEEKMTIARNLLSKSHCLFLAKFGQFLKPEHLQYFEKSKEEDYEVAHHITRLHRYFNNSTRQKDIKNRRYQALKKLIEKGEYFSESEMMKRNPLLYEQLVGQYMTEKQEKARDNVDGKTNTFVNLLMESIDKDNLRKKQKLQEEEEGAAVEETDSTDEDEDYNKECRLSQESPKKVTRILWGEDNRLNDRTNEVPTIKNQRIPLSITKKEKQLLKQEFITNMYQSFLNGNDSDFDYSTVDDNEAYDNIDIRTQDEEEKYFDSESPDIVGIEHSGDCHLESLSKKNDEVKSAAESESEDELDIYMKSLKAQVATKIISLDNQT